MEHEPQSPTQVVAARVRALRGARGWTAQQLAEAMTAAGIPWERPAVTKLETGRRRSLSLEEFFTLAYVLGVAPVNLATSPDLGADDIAVVPGAVAPPRVVREWIRGRHPLNGQDPRRYFTEVAPDDWPTFRAVLKDFFPDGWPEEVDHDGGR